MPNLTYCTSYCIFPQQIVRFVRIDYLVQHSVCCTRNLTHLTKPKIYNLEQVMKKENLRFKSMNTSQVRNHFSEVVDSVLAKERVMFKRYGKDKAALMTTDDADIIKYLLDEEDYERVLKLAREVNEEEEEITMTSEINQNTG